ncbi:MAG: hypothetical protein AB7P23_12705 [Amphiplicatus sp.]
MKSNAPWSVKGIERDARETAKEAARREGMTVGEWLSQVIFAAGDPASSDGEIEGLKISDLVKAIEHLNKRVIHAEFKSAAGIDDLARNFGGAVERLQRLERIKPGDLGAGAGAEFEDRLARVEEKVADRQRIEALRALERAVSQAALQFDAVQKSSLSRLDATERQMQELASRLDEAAPLADSAPDPASKQRFDELAARIARAEELAAQAAEPPAEADPDFAERTGARLRILGDEIKRGGDQIRALEGLIKKLADQIDAAERRSAESVAKISETISGLTTDLARPRHDETRQEIQSAVAAIESRAEKRIDALEQSFEEALARFGAARPARQDEIAPAEAESEASKQIEEKPDSDFGDPFDALDELEEDGLAAREAEDDAEPLIDLDTDAVADDEDDDAFAFDLDAGDDPEDAPDDEAVRAGEAADEADEDGALAVPQDGLDAILAEFDRVSEPPPAPTTELGDLPAVDDRDDDEAEPAAISASNEAMTRRKLTPKQRAILAAKLRRRRQLETNRVAPEPDRDPAPTAPAVAPATTGDAPSERPSVMARVTLMLGGLAAWRPREERQESARDDNPNISRAAQAAFRHIKTRPITIALGVAILIAAVALFFLAKDLMFAGKSAARALQHASQPVGQSVNQAAPAATPAPPKPTVADAQADPRALYFKSVAALKTADSDAALQSAVSDLKQAAEAGHAPAQLQLGELYKLGQGVAQNPVEARRWYEKAALGGNVLAMHRMGVMAARGQGGSADQAEAVRWFEKAGNLGLVDSQYNLGALFHPGGDSSSSSIQDAGKAYYWYALAAKNGDDQAGALALGLGAGLPAAKRKSIDADIAKWSAGTPDPAANEIAPAS